MPYALVTPVAPIFSIRSPVAVVIVELEPSVGPKARNTTALPTVLEAAVRIEKNPLSAVDALIVGAE
jgi:hypothetical protein